MSDVAALASAICEMQTSNPKCTAIDVCSALRSQPAFEDVVFSTVERELSKLARHNAYSSTAQLPPAESEETVRETVTLPTLNDEDVSLILSLLPIGTLPACAATCKHWATVLRGDGLLWREIFRERFGGQVAATDARHACRRCMSTICQISMQKPGSAHLSKRAGSAAGQLNGYTIISGGATDGFEFTRHVDIWEPATEHHPRGCVLARAVNTVGDILPRRWQHTAVSWGDKIWLYGGQDHGHGHPCGLLHVLRTTKQTESEGSTRDLKCVSMHVPLTRCEDDMLESSVEQPLLHWPHEGPAVTGHTARVMQCVDGAHMLSFGGKAPGGPITNLLWRVKLEAFTELHATSSATLECLEWRLLEAAGSTPAPRYCHAAVDISRGWLIFGGWGQNSVEDSGIRQLNSRSVFLNDLHILELPVMSWSALTVAGAIPRGRCQSVMVAAPDEEIILLFGGACHHDPKPGQAYGDMVMDLYDMVLLHLPTLTWLPQKGLPSNYQQRGGMNTLIRTDDGRCFVFGGMNSDEGQNEPNFQNDLTELIGLNAGSHAGAAAGHDGTSVTELN